MTSPVPDRLQLPAELTIYTVGELRPQWLAWLAARAETGAADGPVDAAAVDEVDAAGVQLLVSLWRRLEQLGMALRLHDASPALREALTMLGVAALLDAERVDDGVAA